MRRSRSDRTSPASTLPRFRMASMSISPRRWASAARAWSKVFRPSNVWLPHLKDALPMPRRLSTFGTICSTLIASPRCSGFCLGVSEGPPSVVVGGPNMHLVGLDELLLAGAGEVDADPRAAGAAELPAGRVQLRRLSQVAGLSHALAVCESHRRPRAWVAQPNLASGLQME